MVFRYEVRNTTRTRGVKLEFPHFEHKFPKLQYNKIVITRLFYSCRKFPGYVEVLFPSARSVVGGTRTDNGMEYGVLSDIPLLRTHSQINSQHLCPESRLGHCPEAINWVMWQMWHMVPNKVVNNDGVLLNASRASFFCSAFAGVWPNLSQTSKCHRQLRKAAQFLCCAQSHSCCPQ